MAGSLADFVYFDDRNRAYLIRIDKSNALSSGTGFEPIKASDLSLDYLPRNIEARFVTCQHPSRPIPRKIYCASLAAPLWTGAQVIINLPDYQDRSIQEFRVRDRTREKVLYSAKLIDTYQNDTP